MSDIRMLSFSITGEGLTNILKDFISSGKFIGASKIITNEGTLQRELVKDFLLGKFIFEGDTREEDGTLTIRYLKDIRHRHTSDIIERVVQGILTIFSEDLMYNFTYDYPLLKTYLGQSKVVHKELNCFFDFFTEEEFSEYFSKKLLLRYYDIKEVRSSKKSNYQTDGLILPDGTFVSCNYQGHNELYSCLKELLVMSRVYSVVREDNPIIHVSSGEVNGTIAYELESFYKQYNGTEEQLQTLFDFREELNGVYGRSESITHTLLEFFKKRENFGSKYSNLVFLQRFYKNIHIPKFSKNPEDFDLHRRLFVRTSPKYSIPGLLNSRLTKNNILSVNDTIEVIKKEFYTYSRIEKDERVTTNELNLFFKNSSKVTQVFVVFIKKTFQ